MDEENQNNITADPACLSMKRKRGRPRKDDVSGSDSSRRISHKNGHSPQVENVLVGQFVSGVLDGRFDAGYMLTVTVGSTGSVLTGVVFEPGRSVPISAENDIAPNVQMLKRSNVSGMTTGHHSQPRQFKNDVIIQPKGPSPVPVDINFKLTPKVEIDQDLVPKTKPEVIQTDANHKSSLGVPSSIAKEIQAIETELQSSAPKAKGIEAIGMAPQSSAPKAREVQAIETTPQSSSAPEAKEIQSIEVPPQYSNTEAMEMQANEKASQTSASEAMEIQTSVRMTQYSASEAMEIQTSEDVLQSSVPEPKEIQKTENVVTKVVQLDGNMKDLPTVFLQTAAAELPTSKAKNITKTSCHNDVPTLEKENLVQEHQTETTINFLGSHEAGKPLVDASSGEHKEILMGNDSKKGKNIPIASQEHEEPRLAAQDLVPKTSNLADTGSEF